MDYFIYRNNQLYCEDVCIDELAEKVGTPMFVYSKGAFMDHYRRFSEAFKELDPLICYSIKNNSNTHIINILVGMGSGIDVVSGGELFKALKGGVEPSKVVYAGVGKTGQELKFAFETGIGWLNIESEQEFQTASSIAENMKKEIKAALRVNPNTYDSKTHDKCATGKVDTKFGVDISNAVDFFKKYGNHPYLKLKGIHIHLGSPLYSSEPYVKGIAIILDLVEKLKNIGIEIEMIDIGGGFLAHYNWNEQVKTWNEYAKDIVPMLLSFKEKGGTVVLEPGRSISGNAGILVSRVQYVKKGLEKQFVILDTGMGHNIRPTLYDAYHFIWPTKIKPEFYPVDRSENFDIPGLVKYDIVGPICESSDYLAKDRKIPPVDRGDLLGIFTSGAYCMTMSSQYNGFPRPPEILVDGNNAKIIRKRETYEDLISHEIIENI